MRNFRGNRGNAGDGRLTFCTRRLPGRTAAQDDNFGGSVAIREDTVLVGADGEDGAGSSRGTAYVYGLQRVYVYLPLAIRNW